MPVLARSAAALPPDGHAPAADLVPRADDERTALAGPDAEHLLRVVLEAEGVELVDWSVHQVHHRPGVGVTVGWAVRWRGPAGSGTDYLLGTTAPVPSRTGSSTTAVLHGMPVTVWRHPYDPVLPGLAVAADVSRVAQVLAVPPSAVHLQLVAYRPLRRAVVRVSVGGPDARQVYLKVVRPHTAAALRRRHGLLRAAGVPAASCRDLGDGLLVLDALPGVPLTAALAADGAVGIDPGAVVEVLDALPDGLLAMPWRPSWSDRVRHHTAAAATAVPDHARDLEVLGRQVERRLALCDAGPVVPTHGDLHDANLLVGDDGAVVGLLDVDNAGPGHRVDDLACVLGHLSVLPALAPVVHRHVPGALARWTGAFEGVVDPVALRVRAAAVALSLVAGARRDDGSPWRADAERRIRAVRSWLDAADDAAGEGVGAVAAGVPDLRGLSSSRPAPLMRGTHTRQHGGSPSTRRDPGPDGPPPQSEGGPG